MRIVFEGELSEKNKNVIVKAQQRKNTVFGIIFGVLLCVPITLLVIKVSLICIALYSMSVIMIIGQCFPPSASLVCPNTIVVDQEDVSSLGKIFSQHRKVYDIKSIDDCGDFYRIWFSFPHKSILFLCQKDLVVEGTIEDFEELFVDKIVRKTEQN